MENTSATDANKPGASLADILSVINQNGVSMESQESNQTPEEETEYLVDKLIKVFENEQQPSETKELNFTSDTMELNFARVNELPGHILDERVIIDATLDMSSFSLDENGVLNVENMELRDVKTE